MKITEAKQMRDGLYKAIFASLFVKQMLTCDQEKCAFWCLDLNNKLCYDKQSILSSIDENGSFSEEVKDCICSCLDFYIQNVDKFNTLIQKHLKNDFTIDKLAKCDLAILYTAMTELFCNKELDLKIIVSEAVELAKKYSSENAFKFINGILRNIVKELNKNE